MNDNPDQRLTKKQRRELRKQERLADAGRDAQRGRIRKFVIFGVVAIAAAGLIFALTNRGTAPGPDEFASDNDPYRGPEQATVVIEEYSDFQCPACQYAEAALPQLLDAYPAEVKLVYNDFPLSIHANARQAAEAAQCAFVQGKFWDYHDRLFAEQSTWTNQGKADFTTTLKQYAADLSLDTGKFNQCLDQGEQSQAVRQDIAEGNRRKINSTPTFFVNGVETVGGKTLDQWKALVEDALTKVRASANGNANLTEATNANT